MAQTPAKFVAEGEAIDFTASADAAAGDVLVTNAAIPGVTSEAIDYSESSLGALRIDGVFDFPQAAEIITLGQDVYWDADGNPYGGTAGSGAATATSTGNKYLGVCLETTTATTSYVRVKRVVTPANYSPPVPSATVAATGSVQGDAAAIKTGFTLVSAADATKGVKLPAAAAGLQCIVKNNVNAVLKVWPNTDDAINAIAANSALSVPALTSCIFTAYDSTTWYTTPLLPS